MVPLTSTVPPRQPISVPLGPAASSDDHFPSHTSPQVAFFHSEVRRMSQFVTEPTSKVQRSINVAYLFRVKKEELFFRSRVTFCLANLISDWVHFLGQKFSCERFGSRWFLLLTPLQLFWADSSLSQGLLWWYLHPRFPSWTSWSRPSLPVCFIAPQSFSLTAGSSSAAFLFSHLST